MVIKTHTLSKSAFTMIEFIFAIVVIGITMVSLPMINQVVSKGVEGNLVQEAVFAASTELNQVLSYHWDENSTQGNDTVAKVIWTSNTDCDPNTKLRPGHVNEPMHRRCLDNNVTRPSALGSDSADLDDIDDNIKSTASTIFLGTAGTKTGYKQDYNSTVDVVYDDFDPDPTFTSNNNIKKVTVTISDADGVVTVLRAFSANIGEIDYNKRSY